MLYLKIALLATFCSSAAATIGFCNDKDVSCAGWSRDGMCETDEVVKELCPHSCGVCPIICSDRPEHCANWAKDGECKTSCGLCAPRCVDLTPDCNHWGKQGDCDSNPGFMHLQCPVTCGVCRGTCKDTHDDCPGWAKEGECLNNPGHTLKAPGQLRHRRVQGGDGLRRQECD